MISELKGILSYVSSEVTSILYTHWNTAKEIPRNKYPALVIDGAEIDFNKLAQAHLYQATLNFDAYLINSYPRNDEDFDEVAFEALTDSVIDAFLKKPGYLSKNLKYIKVGILEIAGKKEASALLRFEYTWNEAHGN